jgi:hypothetical protein
VHGDAAVVGGTLELDNNAVVDGDVGVVGGSLKRANKAHIGGKARDDTGELKVNVDLSNDDDDDESEDAHAHDHHADAAAHTRSRVTRVLSEVGQSITLTAFLFIFGAILLALMTSRMDALKTEVASRPMRTFALGVVGTIVAAFSFLMLCVTIIGIPVAIVGFLAAVVAVYAGITATLTTAGQAVLGHKTKNPYVHLAAGCAMLLVLGSLPHVGKLVWLVIMMIGVGTLVATRGAGFVPKRNRMPSDPYRTAADR